MTSTFRIELGEPVKLRIRREQREDFYPFDYESNGPVAPGYSWLPADRPVGRKAHNDGRRAEMAFPGVQERRVFAARRRGLGRRAAPAEPRRPRRWVIVRALAAGLWARAGAWGRWTRTRWATTATRRSCSCASCVPAPPSAAPGSRRRRRRRRRGPSWRTRTSRPWCHWAVDGDIQWLYTVYTVYTVYTAVDGDTRVSLRAALWRTRTTRPSPAPCSPACPRAAGAQTSPAMPRRAGRVRYFSRTVAPHPQCAWPPWCAWPRCARLPPSLPAPSRALRRDTLRARASARARGWTRDAGCAASGAKEPGWGRPMAGVWVGYRCGPRRGAGHSGTLRRIE
jgi:hypothetical protein